MAERDIVPEPDADGSAGDSAVPDTTGKSPFDMLSSYSDVPTPIHVIRQPSQRTAALRQQLAEKAAATDELREALDQLRQVLDIDHPPQHPGTPGDRRRLALAVTLVGVVLLVLGVVAFLLVDKGLGGTSADDAPAASNPAASHPAASNPAAANPAASNDAATSPGVTGAQPSAVELSPLPWPGGAVLLPPGLVTTGPGVDTPGTDVQVALDDDGVHLDVFERLLLPAPAGDPLALVAPSLPAIGVTSVTDLQVQLDGTAVPATGSGASWTAAPAHGAGWTRAVLRYRLVGGVVTVTPAAPGRELGLVTPLTATISQAGGHAVVVRTLDRHVLGVSCPAVQGSGAVCGARGTTGWTATPPPSAPPVVLLQITR